jgi:hypothetical protein
LVGGFIRCCIYEAVFSGILKRWARFQTPIFHPVCFKVFWTPAFAGVTTKKASYDLFKPIGKDPMQRVEAQR